jgi:hypothetical protein
MVVAVRRAERRQGQLEQLARGHMLAEVLEHTGEVIAVARLRGSDIVQYICLDEDSLQWLVSAPGPSVVRSIAERVSELPRVVDEYVSDAIVELEPSRSLALTEGDRAWLIAHAAAMSLSEIEKASLRLVALRSSENLSQAAERLGMAAVSLARWAGRRKLPTHSSTATAA